MDLLGRIKAAQSRRSREAVPESVRAALDLPEGETLYVCEATAKDIDDYQAGRVKTTFDARGKSTSALTLENVKARLVVRCLVCEDWSYALRAEDVAALGELGQTVLEPLYEMALRLNGLSSSADDDLKGKLAPNASAPTASPLPLGSGTSTA